MVKINESTVAVGGGGGVYRLVRFLKRIRTNITTIQTVFDHGGHSGELRDERGVLPPGDLRQAILGLSSDNLEPALRQLMAFRFAPNGNSSLDRATVGNIMLTALSEITGSLPAGINALCAICGVEGRVLPVSLDNAELCAVLSDDSVLEGEGLIDTRSIEDDRYIKSVFLRPKAHIYVEAYRALIEADKIVFCPGDTYTSLLPNILVDGFKEAIHETKAKLIFCVNIMTKKSETDGYDVTRFTSLLSDHLCRKLDYVVYNNEPLSPQAIKSYEAEKARPVCFKRIDKAYAHNYIGANLVSDVGGVVRHHERVASIIADL